MSKRFVARRVAVAVATLAAVIVFNFFLFRAAGDPERDLLRGGKLTPAAIDKIIEERGLHDSLPTQYWLYLGSTSRAATSSAASTAASPSRTSCSTRSRTR